MSGGDDPAAGAGPEHADDGDDGYVNETVEGSLEDPVEGEIVEDDEDTAAADPGPVRNAPSRGSSEAGRMQVRKPIIPRRPVKPAALGTARVAAAPEPTPAAPAAPPAPPAGDAQPIDEPIDEPAKPAASRAARSRTGARVAEPSSRQPSRQPTPGKTPGKTVVKASPEPAGAGEPDDRSRSLTIPLNATMIVASIVALALLAFGVGYGISSLIKGATGTSTSASGGGEDQAAGDPGRFGACPTAELRIQADPSISGTLGRTLATSGCKSVKIETLPSWATATDLNNAKGPDMWIPDSTMWRLRLNSNARAVTVLPSVATTPVVVASPVPYVANSWKQVFTDPTFKIGNPLSNSSALAPLLAMRSELSPEDWQKTSLQVARGSIDSPEAAAEASKDDASRLDDVISAQNGVVAVPEQIALKTNDQAVLSLPPSGTIALDYPLISTMAATEVAAKQEAVDWFKGFLESKEVQDNLKAEGFRNADAEPITGSVGDYTSIKLPGRKQITLISDSWSVLTIPNRVLVVMDVSGSMNYTVPDGRSRMQVTREVLAKGINYYPEIAQIGLWYFSQGIAQWGGADHKEVLPIRPLGGRFQNNETQRELLNKAFARTEAISDGGTALNDTILASYKEVQNTYDPAATNWLIFFTDGSNDDPNSISQEKLLAELRRIQDPSRNVITVFLGITGDADKAALEAVADATGGTAAIVDNPADLDALLSAALGGLK